MAEKTNKRYCGIGGQAVLEGVMMKNKDKYAVAAALADVTEKVRHSLGVRMVVRPSGTEQLIRIMAEGESYENCVTACGEIRAAAETL